MAIKRPAPANQWAACAGWVPLRMLARPRTWDEGDWEDGDLYPSAPCPFRATIDYFGTPFCVEHFGSRAEWERPV